MLASFHTSPCWKERGSQRFLIWSCDSFQGKVALLSHDAVAVRRGYFHNCGAFKDTLSFVSSFMSCRIRNSNVALIRLHSRHTHKDWCVLLGTFSMSYGRYECVCLCDVNVRVLIDYWNDLWGFKLVSGFPYVCSWAGFSALIKLTSAGMEMAHQLGAAQQPPLPHQTGSMCRGWSIFHLVSHHAADTPGAAKVFWALKGGSHVNRQWAPGLKNPWTSGRWIN